MPARRTPLICSYRRALCWLSRSMRSASGRLASTGTSVGTTRLYCSRATASSSASRSGKCWNTERSDTPARAAISAAVGRGRPSSSRQISASTSAWRVRSALTVRPSRCSEVGPIGADCEPKSATCGIVCEHPLDSDSGSWSTDSRDADGTQRAKPRGCEARPAARRLRLTSADLKREVRVSLIAPASVGAICFSGPARRQLALRDPPEAAPLLHVGPRARDEAGRQLEAAHQLARDHRPGPVLLDQVAAHLEVPLPAELGRMVVG